METTDLLAKPYAVFNEEGVVIDRILISDQSYESLDFSLVYPDCTIELDEENLFPIGHGAPEREPVESLANSEMPLDVALRSLNPVQKAAILAALAPQEEAPQVEDSAG